jgi:hypothetical protein
MVMEKEVRLPECLALLGSTEYNRQQAAILLHLTCKKDNMQEKLAGEKVDMMIQKCDRDKENSVERIRGKDIPPHLLGYFPYALLMPPSHGLWTWPNWPRNFEHDTSTLTQVMAFENAV